MSEILFYVIVFGCVCALLGAAWGWIALLARAIRDKRSHITTALILAPLVLVPFGLFEATDDLLFALVSLVLIALPMVLVVYLVRHSRKIAALCVVAAVFFTVIVIYSLGVFLNVVSAPKHSGHRLSQPDHDPQTEVLKKDCEQLVLGELVFTPETTMQQGKAKTLSARLSRGTDIGITQGLENGVVVQNTQVSCMVSLSLSSQEENAFTIVSLPEGRSDEQVLRANHYSQWDWRVTPLKAGSLHLLLYVTPMLYIDGVGKGLESFPQPPRLITVTPDHLYASKQFLKTYWTSLSAVATVIVIPLFVWGYKKWAERRAEEREKQKPVGFAPHK